MSSLIKKTCLNCHEDFFVEYRLREQKCCSYKCSYNYQRKKKERELICGKCGKTYTLSITDYKFEKGDYRKFCSDKCSKGRKWSDEHKIKLSEICKNSEKVKKANQRIGISKRKNGIQFTCLYCGEIGYDNNKNRKYHSECWLKCSGGLRKGSSRGKHGWYENFWCDSSYELAFLIYCLEHDIKIERNRKGYKYHYKEKDHYYYPDFRVDGVLTEIKNFKSELTDVKIKSVDEKINVIYKDTINPYLEYVIEKYGKDFVKLLK